MHEIRQLQRVVLLNNVPADKLIDGDVSLVAGDIGVIVEILSGGGAFILEFFALDGYTVALAKVEASEVRPIGLRDLYHARVAARESPRTPRAD